jgi:hypothetical protein
MAKENKAAVKEATISGFVEEIELEDGDPGVQLDAEDYPYQVVMDKQGKRLLDHIDEEIEAVGVVSIVKGIRQIKIIRFEVLDSLEDDDEEYDYDDNYGDDNDD